MFYGTVEISDKSGDGHIAGNQNGYKHTDVRHESLNEKYRLLAENTLDVIWVIDPQLKFTYVNAAVLKITGYTVDECIDSNLTDFFSKQESARLKEILKKETAKGHRHQGLVFEVELTHKDGSKVNLEIHGKIKFDEAGAIKEIYGTSRDITDKKILERQLHQSQKMEAIGKLAGGVAHDFNNLITVINGYTELLLQEKKTDDPDFERLTQIMKAGLRSESLTRQLLAFSRKQVLQPVVLNMNSIVNDTEKMLRRLIGENIVLTTMLSESLHNIEVDPGQLEQIILNLSVNARDAMPHGGSLIIETNNIYLDEAYVENHHVVNPGAYVLLSVTDSGTGMDVETQNRIFEPFYTTKKEGEGTGLGLSTVYGIVKQSGGFIWVYSEPNQGTTFKIYFPAANSAAETKDEDRTEKEQHFNEIGTVLVAEDDENLRKLIEVSLKSFGYKTIMAENGADALKIIRDLDEPIDLLLSDVVMPEVSGKKLYEEIKKTYPNMKICFMSGYTDGVIAKNGILENGLNFLQKPFTPKSLASKIREILNS